MTMKPKGMHVQMTAYDVLGVARTATNDEIKLAFRRIATIYHPDHRKVVEGWEDPWPQRVMQMASDAHKMLLDPEQRAAYDAFLEGREQPQPQRQQEGPEIVPRNPPLVGQILDGVSKFVDPNAVVDLATEFTAEQIKAWMDRFNRRRGGHQPE